MENQLQQIIDLHNDMKPLLMRAKISEENYLAPIKDIGLYTVEEVEELLDWIRGVYDKEYKEVYTIFKLPGDDSLWDKYVTFGIEGLPEQILFNKAAKELRRVWNKPYRPNRKFINAAKQETNHDHAQGNSIDSHAKQVQSQS